MSPPYNKLNALCCPMVWRTRLVHKGWKMPGNFGAWRLPNNEKVFPLQVQIGYNGIFGGWGRNKKNLLSLFVPLDKQMSSISENVCFFPQRLKWNLFGKMGHFFFAIISRKYSLALKCQESQLLFEMLGYSTFFPGK